MVESRVRTRQKLLRVKGYDPSVTVPLTVGAIRRAVRQPHAMTPAGTGCGVVHALKHGSRTARGGVRAVEGRSHWGKRRYDRRARSH